MEANEEKPLRNRHKINEIKSSSSFIQSAHFTPLWKQLAYFCFIVVHGDIQI